MILFHYCSEEKFMNILKSKKLWLPRVDTMNDRDEMIHLYKNVWNDVKKIIIENHKFSNMKEIFEIIDNDIENIVPYVDKPYCACFSDNGDLLSQWREYADGANGFAIGFDADWFKIQYKAPHPNAFIERSIGIDNIIYDYNRKVTLLYSLIKRIFENIVSDATDWVMIKINLKAYSAIFKNESFYTERERRIIYYEERDHIYSDDFINGPFPYNNSTNRYELSWYRSISDHAIKYVYLAPKNLMSIQNVLKLLSHYDITIQENCIIKSRSTYVEKVSIMSIT